MQIEVQCQAWQHKNGKTLKTSNTTVNTAFEFAYSLSYK